MSDSIHHWDTIVHIGAGNAKELPSYRRANPKRLILVEPQARLAEWLRQATLDINNCEVFEYAVTTVPGNHTLLINNFSPTSSLRQPTGLKDLYPGLKGVTEAPVETQHPCALLKRLDLSEKGQHWLIIQANGEEGEILQSLLESGQLVFFSCIDCSLPERPLYLNSLTIENLRPKLEGQGYDIVIYDSQDPDYPLWRITYNSFRAKAEALTLKLAKKNNQIHKLNEEGYKLKETIEKLHITAEERLKQLNEYKQQSTQLKAENQRLEGCQQKMQEELMKAETQINLIKGIMLREGGE